MGLWSNLVSNARRREARYRGYGHAHCQGYSRELRVVFAIAFLRYLREQVKTLPWREWQKTVTGPGDMPWQISKNQLHFITTGRWTASAKLPPIRRLQAGRWPCSKLRTKRGIAPVGLRRFPGIWCAGTRWLRPIWLDYRPSTGPWCSTISLMRLRLGDKRTDWGLSTHRAAPSAIGFGSKQDEIFVLGFRLCPDRFHPDKWYRLSARLG